MLAICAVIAGCGGASMAHAQTAPPQFKAEHAILVVWDGMRPDFITPEVAPTLYKLSQEGVLFSNHHAVYISSTEVNGTALATGCFPQRSGVIANHEYRPDLNLTSVVSMESIMTMRIGDALTGGKYLGVPTIAETIQRAGFPTLIAGTKPVTALQDRNVKRNAGAAKQSILLYAGDTLPKETSKKIEKAIGDFPEYPTEAFVPDRAQNQWTTRALTEILWKNGVPKFSVLWLSDPDYTQHQTGPGADPALEAIRESDANLATLLAALDAKGLRDKTNIFIASDHGFSTVDRVIDLWPILKKAGFDVTRDGFRQSPRNGQVLINSLGGSTFLYVIGKDPAIKQRLVDFLQNSSFAGPIFTKEGLEGTFKLADARIDSPDAPDVVFSYRWTRNANRFGALGTFVSDGGSNRRPGYGMHASLSPADLHNICVGTGPDLKRGFKDELPSANIDVAPTILHLLGIPQLEPMDGRVLLEALEGSDPSSVPEPKKQRMEASRTLIGTKWTQYLQTTMVGDHFYLDEGNAEQVAP